jgi:hypothetical protein
MNTSVVGQVAASRLSSDDALGEQGHQVEALRHRNAAAAFAEAACNVHGLSTDGSVAYPAAA